MVASPPPRPEKPAGLELSGPLSPDDQEFITEHLAEGRVFRKYGLGDKARDQFEAILGRFPDNLEALQELVDIHREKGENEAAAQRMRVMAEVHGLKGDPGQAARVDAEANGLFAPVVAPAAEVRAVVTPPPVAPAAVAPPTADVGLEITVEEPGAGEEPSLEEFDDLEAAPPEPEAPPAIEAGDLAPAGGDFGSHFIDEEEPPVPDGAFDLEDLPPAPPAPPAPLVTTGLVVPGAPAAAPVSDAPADLQRALGEIESYVSMGFVDDARGVLDEVGERLAVHPGLVQRLEELGLEAPATAPADAEDLVLADAPPAPAEEPLVLGADFLEFTPTTSAPAVEPPPEVAEPPAALPTGGDGADAFDLASELGDLFGAQPAVAAEAPVSEGTDLGDASLADIFREFQKGVDKQLGKEDYETRYNLGIAYKEMGLVDEAIAEFQLAAKDEGRLLECASMLGICFLEKGMPKLAVKWFEKGIQAPGRSEEEYQGLRYDLASALEQAGESDRALALFTELYGQDASFRDVADKVRQLDAGR